MIPDWRRCRLYPWPGFWAWRERGCEAGSEAEPRPPSGRAAGRSAPSTFLAAPCGLRHWLPEGATRSEAQVLAQSLAAAELTLQRPAILARALPGRAAAVLRHRRRAHAPCRSWALSRAAAAHSIGTPAEVNGLSNGGAGQKGRLECLYIISLLRRPLIFLPNARCQPLQEAGV